MAKPSNTPISEFYAKAADEEGAEVGLSEAERTKLLEFITTAHYRAMLVKIQRDAYVAQGFTPEQAMRLVCSDKI